MNNNLNFKNLKNYTLDLLLLKLFFNIVFKDMWQNWLMRLI